MMKTGIRPWFCIVLAGLCGWGRPAVCADFSAWQQRTRVTSEGYSRPETLTEFPVLITFSNRPGFSYDDFLSPPWADLRFADSAMTELPFEVEAWNTNGTASVWVRWPAISGADSFIWAFWGREGQTAPAHTENGSVWSNQYAAVWHLDDSTNNASAWDSSPNKRHLVNTVSSNTAGVIASAQDFQATAWMTGTGGLGNLSVTGVTLSAWVQLRGGYNYPMVLTCNGVGMMDFRFNGTTRQIQQLFGASTTAVGPADAIPENEWHHVAMTLDDGSDQIRLFVDGRPAAFLATATNHAPAGGTVYLARRSDTYRYNGLIDEVQVSSLARSTNWIWASFMNQASNASFVSTVSGFPQIRNTACSDLTDAAVTLNASLFGTSSAPAAVTLYWGLANGGAAADGWAFTNAFPEPILPGPLSTNLAGLPSNTVYWFAFHATNDLGECWATPSSFKPLGPPSVDNGGGADRVGFASARLHGDLLDGTSAGVIIRWGESAGDLTNEIALGTLPVGPFAWPLAGLSDGTAYYYSCFVSNAYGWTASADGVASFTTVPRGVWHCSTNGPAWGDGSSWELALTNIQAALTSAKDGDAIRLAGQAFTQAAPLLWAGRSGLRLEGGWEGTGNPGSRDSARWPTVLQRHPSYAVRVMQIQAATNGVLDQVTIRNGSVNTVPSLGGGLLVYTSSLAFADCVFSNNTAASSVDSGVARGGGLYALNSSLSLSNCLFIANLVNSSSKNGLLTGGGACLQGGTGTFERCAIRRNTLNGIQGDTRWGNSCYGGGLYADGALVVRNSRISGNHAKVVSADAGKVDKGGGLYAAGAASLFNTLVAFNDASRDAGASDSDGAYLAPNARSEVLNCTFLGNDGEGLRTSGGAGAAVSNSIFWMNGDDLAGFGTNSAGLLTNVWFCDIQNGDNAGLQGCRSDDPGYARGLFLAADSPCLDAGGGDAADWGLGGKTVRLDGAADAGAVDLGVHADAGPDPALAELYVSESGSDSNAGTTPEQAFRTVTKAVAAAGEGSRIHVGPGVYGSLEDYPLNLDKSGLWLLGDEGGGTILTALGGNKRVITAQEAADIRLERLSLTGGALSSTTGGAGGGLYAGNVLLAVSDCRITNNAVYVTLNESQTGPMGCGFYAYAARVAMSGCEIARNLGTSDTGGYRSNVYRGGGLAFSGGEAVMADCVIASNRLVCYGYSSIGDTAQGAGIHLTLGSLRLERCLMMTNTLYSRGLGWLYGGGVYSAGKLAMVNCLVAANDATSLGGAAFGDGFYGGGTLAATNVTVAGNPGQGVYYSGATQRSLVNSIVWGNGDDLAAFATNAAGALTGVHYCDIEDGDNQGTNGCFSADPLFADAVYFHPASRAGTYEGGWFSGGTWVKNAVHSPAIDAGDPASACDAEPLPNGRKVNLGAYGNTSVASLSLTQGTFILIR